MYKIGIKYCGGCNAKFDRRVVCEDIVKSVKEALEDKNLDITFFDYDLGTSCDVLVVMGGCHACCATYYEEDVKDKVIRIVSHIDRDNAVKEILSLAG